MGGKVLSVASECVPLVKTGGLADVVGALPGALAPQGWEMRVLLPAYRALQARAADWPTVLEEPDLWGGTGRLLFGTVEGVGVYLLDAPHLYDREGGPYGHDGVDWPDNAQRFAALSWVAARIAREGAGGWKPDILHAHDWQAGFAPAYLRYHAGEEAGRCRAVLTVHNIAFQGWFPAQLLGELRLPTEEFHPRALEYYGGISSLKAGMICADRITTVSPNYMAELMRPEYGMGLQGVIAERAAIVSGILNGVDTEVWAPEKEPQNPYGPNSMDGKKAARSALCAEFGIRVPGPLLILVSRLTDQKGIDLIPEAIDDFIKAGGGLVVLGSGEKGLEEAMLALRDRHPGRISVRLGYDEALSHRMFQGGDAVLVPSRFEPCGLTQLYGLRYGTVPVVAAVGGLADTVIHASPAAIRAKAATGVTFWPVDVLGLRGALRQLVQLHADRKLWKQIVLNGMSQNLGWEVSAGAYARLYQGLLP